MGKWCLFLIAKGSDLQDPELAHGLQPKTVECFIAEIKPDLSVLAEEPTAYWGEAADPANAVVRPSLSQDCWNQLQKFDHDILPARRRSLCNCWSLA